MFRNISHLIFLFGLCAFLFFGSRAGAAETVVQNDNGGVGAPVTAFIPGDHASAWLTSPCDGKIVAVQIYWASQSGVAPDHIEQSITVFAAGTFPTPGAVLINDGGMNAEISAPTLTDGVLNEFRDLLPTATPLSVPVTSGQTFVVSLEFFNENDGNPFAPSVVADTDGCQSGKNAFFTAGFGWGDACAAGVPGDWLIRAVVDCAPYQSCAQTCQLGCPGGALDENESDCGAASDGGDGTDDVNGGCSFSPLSLFSPMSCGDTYCGTVGGVGGWRDFDYYFFELTSSTKILASLRPEFNAHFWLYETSADCSVFNFIASRTSRFGACEERVFDECLPPGTYTLIVSTAGIVNGLPCGSAYNLELSCGDCVGACCDEQAGLCTDDVMAQNCPGSWYGGQTCCEVECPDLGGAYTSSGLTLLSQTPLSAFPGSQTLANEAWGYTSPSGREYAIIGFTKGTGFVDITDPTNPQVVGYIDGGGVDQPWRDMDVFGEYAYIVSDGDGVGLQIADLTDIDGGNVTLANTTDLGQGFIDAHNLRINSDSGYLYLCIPDLNGGLGLTVVDLNVNPTDPSIVGFWDDFPPNTHVQCHDVQVVTYTSGPYAGREIAFCAAEDDGFWIGDVTDKNNIFSLSNVCYPDLTYAHQGRLTEDRKYFLLGDELDELDEPNVTNTTTYVFDVQDLLNPSLFTTFSNGLCSIDHNMMVRGTRAYEANYSTGLRVFDISSLSGGRGGISEIGFFDTHPENNGVNFDGMWGVFTDYDSGVIVASDRQRGLFVFGEVPFLVPPTVAGTEAGNNATYDHGSRKNRYLSINAGTNAGVDVALEVTLSSMKRCTNNPRRSCKPDRCAFNSQNAGQLCTASNQCGSPQGNGCISDCGGLGLCQEHPSVGTVLGYVQAPQTEPLSCSVSVPSKFARVEQSVLARNWAADTILHVGDCEIVPIATYEIRACVAPFGPTDCSDPLVIGTVEIAEGSPDGTTNLADVAGPVSIGTGNFTAPDGITSVVDIVAFQQTSANCGTPNLPKVHTTRTDLHGLGTGTAPQMITNVSDLSMIQAGLGGKTWAGTNAANSENRDPLECPGQ